jgi:D-xylose transport system substrate-binding protein
MYSALFHRPKHHAMLSLLLGATIVMILLAGCGSNGGGTNTGNTGPKGCKKIGVLLPESDSSARWESKDHPLLQQYITADLPGATVDYYNAGNDATKQQTQAETALTKGDCILVVAPQDADASAAIVAKAKQSNVPVIAYDRLIQSSDLAYYVSFDNVKVGELQGQYIVDHHNKGDNVMMINGSQTDNNALLFKQGALNKLQPLFDSKELNLVYQTFTPNWNNQTAQTEAEAALTQANNNIQIAYVANDGMANSVIAALKAQGLNGKVVVTGQDATVAGIQNILTGDQGMTVYKAINLEAQATAQLVAALSNGADTASITQGNTTATSTGANIPSVLETPVTVTKDNIADTVLKDGFVTKDEICTGLPAGTDTGGICS